MTLGYSASVLIALAVLVVMAALLALLRRRRRRRQQGADASTQLAALRAASAAALSLNGAEKAADADPADAAADAASDAAAQRESTERALQELALSQKLSGGVEPQEEPILRAIETQLARIVEQPNYAPRRPLLLPKLMKAIGDDAVSHREIVRIVAADPALAGNLLRLANSPFYRHGPDAIESLDRAVALLGLQGMRSMITAALLQPIFRVSGGVFTRFGEITWEHALHAGAAAETHAAIVENSDPFAAQLLALIMGLANIVVFRVGQDEFLARRHNPRAPAIAAVIDRHWVPVARQIAANWALSERIDAALAEQQQPGDIAPSSALGRSLKCGRYLGALAVLLARGAIDEAALASALQVNASYEPVWARALAQRD